MSASHPSRRSRSYVRHATLGGALVLSFAACRASTQEMEPPRTMDSAMPAVSLTSTRNTSAAWMVEHERVALELRDAVVRADLNEAKRSAGELSQRAFSKNATPDFLERAEAMKAANLRVLSATGSEALGREVGLLARTCADCHARFGGPVRVEVGAAPSPRPLRGENRVERRMLRHAWAVSQMWDGLVRNSEPPWRAGAKALRDPALASEELVSKKTPVPEIDRLARSLDAVGARAGATSDTNEKSKIFGELLGTCAACHERTGGGNATSASEPR